MIFAGIQAIQNRPDGSGMASLMLSKLLGQGMPCPSRPILFISIDRLKKP